MINPMSENNLRSVLEPETLAKAFHEAYERLAPQFGYETRKDSAVPWADVPERNRKLMIAVCAELRVALAATQEPQGIEPLGPCICPPGHIGHSEACPAGYIKAAGAPAASGREVDEWMSGIEELNAVIGLLNLNAKPQVIKDYATRRLDDLLVMRDRATAPRPELAPAHEIDPESRGMSAPEHSADCWCRPALAEREAPPDLAPQPVGDLLDVTVGTGKVWMCAARNADVGANDPQDCDWPFCGCDEHADKVIAALQECGWGKVAGGAPPDLASALERELNK